MLLLIVGETYWFFLGLKLFLSLSRTEAAQQKPLCSVVSRILYSLSSKYIGYAIIYISKRLGYRRLLKSYI